MKRNGFTLIELIIYVGIFSILIVMLSQLFLTTIEQQATYQTVSTLDRESRYVLNRLTYDIHRTEQIQNPGTVGSTSSTLRLVIDGNTYTYGTSTNRLALIHPLGNDYLTSNEASISGLTFTRLGNSGGNNSIQVTFTLESQTVVRSQPRRQTYQTTISTRQN